MKTVTIDKKFGPREEEARRVENTWCLAYLAHETPLLYDVSSTSHSRSFKSRRISVQPHIRTHLQICACYASTTRLSPLETVTEVRPWIYMCLLIQYQRTLGLSL